MLFRFASYFYEFNFLVHTKVTISSTLVFFFFFSRKTYRPILDRLNPIQFAFQLRMGDASKIELDSIINETNIYIFFFLFSIEDKLAHNNYIKDSRNLWKVEHRVTRNARHTRIGRVNDRFHKRSTELCYARSDSLTA